MKSLVVSVRDEDLSRLKATLKELSFVEKIVESKTNLDLISLASEPTLAEDWMSDEDDRYDQPNDK